MPRQAAIAHLVGVLAALALIALAAGACGGGSAAGAATGGEIRIKWVLPDGFPARLTVHRALPGRELWQTTAYPAGEPAPVGAELPGGVLHVRFDVPELVTIRLVNPLDRAVRFWVAPHLPQPHEAEHTLLIACLCTGATYEVPAHGTWTRVIQLGIRRRDAITPIAISHVIVLGEAPKVDDPPAGAATR